MLSIYLPIYLNSPPPFPPLPTLFSLSLSSLSPERHLLTTQHNNSCILIPVVLLTAFPPGFLFPAMAEREAQRFKRKNKGEKVASEEPIASGDEGHQTEQKTLGV